jgi:hypothetical protein
MDIRNGLITAYNGISASLGTSNQFNINKSGTNYLNVFNNGRLWIGSGTLVDAGFQMDIVGTARVSGDMRINGLTIGKGNNQDITNTAVGVDALRLNTVPNNTAFGYAALQNLTTGGANTALGRAAGAANVTGNHNVYIGLNTGLVATSGGNTAVGTSAGVNLTTGGSNILLGYQAGFDLTTGNSNVIIGNYVFAGVISANTSNNIIIADGQSNIRIRVFDTGNVTIGGSTDISSAQLQLSSTTKGFLPPRMTAAQRTTISTPAQGLLVYDTGSTTEGLWFYNAGSTPGWQEVLTNTGSQSISGSLSITGSLIMSPSSSFVLPLTASSSPLIGSAYWSGSLLFIWNGTRYMSSSFA